MADNPRIDELRRRVDKDSASIAFAQLAEEYRRAGEYDEAIRVCRSGLEQHPGYLSARVTLGRALLETGQFDDAQNELEQVVRAAPDNLAAIRALADIHQRREEGGLPAHERVPEAPPDIPPLTDLDLQFNASDDHFAAALKTLGGDTFALPTDDVAAEPPPDLPPDPMIDLAPEPVIDELPEPVIAELPPGPVIDAPPPDPVIVELEGWLAAILADRNERRAAKAR